MPDVTKSFSGLPLGLLVCGPIIEIARGQAELCRTYLDHILSLAYKDGDVNKGETNVIKFVIERPVTDTVTGTVSMKPFTVNAPLISLVPVPAFTMDEATVAFTMEVKEQVASKSEEGSEKKVSISGGFWGIKAKVSGSVTTKSENTRSSDHSAKYEIKAVAKQQPAAEGMAKLTALFNAAIDPIELKQGGSDSSEE